MGGRGMAPVDLHMFPMPNTLECPEELSQHLGTKAPCSHTGPGSASPGGLLSPIPEFLTEQVWGGTQESAFPVTSC